MKHPWETLKDLLSIQERVNRLFDDVMSESEGTKESISWCPKVDVYETDNEFVVNAEVPGVTQDNLNIKIDGNVLVIKGYRPLYGAFADIPGNYHRIECSYGGFQRSFLLPEGVDSTGIKASLKDGILQIVLPKKKESVIRQIRIE